MIFIELENGNVELNIGLEQEQNIDLGLETGTIIGDDFKERYEGSYNVIPKIQKQILETYDKIMSDNVTVNAIPYYEVQNPQGGKTVTIGE